MQTAVRVDSVTKLFAAGVGLRELSFDVPEGSVFGFLGPNGAGKTTTIRVLLGLLLPDAGEVRVLGRDPADDPLAVRQQCGVLLHEPGLYGRFSATENLEFFAGMYGIPAREATPRIRELLTSLQLWERRNEHVRTWSRGMRQKLAIARALLHRPRLIILDEPTSGLDVRAAADLRAIIKALVSDGGVTVFLTTHNLHEAEELCDTVAIVRTGEVVAQGPPRLLTTRQDSNRLSLTVDPPSGGQLHVLRDDPAVVALEVVEGKVLLDLSEDADIADVVARAVAAGLRVIEVNRVAPTLEDVFLELTETA